MSVVLCQQKEVGCFFGNNRCIFLKENMILNTKCTFFYSYILYSYIYSVLFGPVF